VTDSPGRISAGVMVKATIESGKGVLVWTMTGGREGVGATVVGPGVPGDTVLSAISVSGGTVAVSV